MSDFSILDSLTTKEDVWFWLSMTSLILLLIAEIAHRVNAAKKETYLAFDQSGAHIAVGGASFWRDRWFWIGLASLAMLAGSQIISHRYTLRKDEIVSELRDEFEDVEKHAIPELKTDLAKSEKEIVRLKIDLEQARLVVLEASKNHTKVEAAFVKSAARDDKSPGRKSANR
jgi:hypothetical protein